MILDFDVDKVNEIMSNGNYIEGLTDLLMHGLATDPFMLMEVLKAVAVASETVSFPEIASLGGNVSIDGIEEE